MDRKAASRLEDTSVVLGSISILTLTVSGFMFIVRLSMGFSVGVALAVAVMAAGMTIVSVFLYAKCQPALEALFIEHEGVIASVGQTKEQNGVVTFGDGYVAELDFALAVEPGSHLTLWRDGWNHLKRVEVKRI